MTGNGTKLTEVPAGIALAAKVMPNGETRTRISHPETGLSLSITSTFEAPEAHGWQNSHRHVSGIIETYVVQIGWLVVARQDTLTSQPLFTHYRSGSVFTLDGEDAHNVYVSPAAIFACVKHGSKEGRDDWVPAKDFDKVVKHLTEADFIPLCHKA